MPTGRPPLFVAVDTGTGFLYVAFRQRCNAETATGCGAAAGEQSVGSGPKASL